MASVPAVVICGVFCFVVFSSLQLISAELPGVCLIERLVNKQRHVLNRHSHPPGWSVVTYQEPVVERQCCENYRPRRVGMAGEELSCEPICETPCQNSTCEAPNTCVCLPGTVMANNSTTSCVDVCESCVNGACPPDQRQCVCNPGFEQALFVPHLCIPVCDPHCESATCVAPNQCECFHNHTKSHDHDNICLPTCEPECLFGHCTDVNECTCDKNYVNDKEQPNICVPLCDPPCENGSCVEPDVCKCDDGYETSVEDHYHCVRSTSSCTFNIAEALQQDKHGCFKLKDNLQIKNHNSCKLFEAEKSKCDEVSDCDLDFKCSMIDSSSKQIHCQLETARDFETDESYNVSLSETNFTDVTLLVHFDTLLTNTTRSSTATDVELLIQPLSKWPVCGEKSFGVQIRLAVKYDQGSHSALRLVGMILFIALLLMAGVGVGSFFWLRHRKSNDPLNYRANMQGYHTNINYDESPTGLIPDDDNEEEHL